MGKSMFQIGDGGAGTQIVPSSKDAVAQISFVSFGTEVVDDDIFDLTIEGGVFSKSRTRVEFAAHLYQTALQYHNGAFDPCTWQYPYITINDERTICVFDISLIYTEIRMLIERYITVIGI